MKTAEVDTINRFMLMLEDIPDEQLAVVIQEAAEEWRKVKDLHDRATFEMRKRLEQNGEGRRVLPNGDIVELEKPANEYEWDTFRLNEARPLLAPGEYDRLVYTETKEVTKVNTRSLLALAERQGGKLKEIVEAACTRKPRGETKVAIKGGVNGSVQSPTPIRRLHD